MRLVIDNNNVVELYNLKNNVSGEFIDDADVKLTIYDSNMDPVGGGIWPQNMDNRGTGQYRVTLEETLVLERGSRYTGVVTAKDTEGRQGRWEMQFVAEPNKVY